MPRIAGGKDIITQPLYDTQQYPAAGTNQPLVFYGTPRGQGTTLFGTGPKNLTDTNMRQAAQLPSPWTFEIFTVQVVLNTTASAALASGQTTVQDLQLLLFGANIVLNIGAKWWLELPIYFAPSGGGLDGVYQMNNIAAPTQGLALHSGVADPGAVFKLSRSITILENENFDVTFTQPGGNAVTTAVNVKVAMGGELSRSIQ